MPSSAIAADLVDYIFPPEKMPEALLAFLGHGDLALSGEPLAGMNAQTAYREVLEILRVRGGHDFRSYKQSTLSRRIQRRLNLKDIETLSEYAGILRDDPGETAARQSAQLLKDLVNALPSAVYTTDAAGLITSYNPAAVKLWGREPQLGVDKWCGSLRMYRVDGTLLPHDECPMAIAVKENRQIMGAEAVIERGDGMRIPFLAYPTPLRDASGIVIGAVNILMDMTERLRTEEHRIILIAELNHRVKNMLAVIQSIASQTFGHAHTSTIDEAREALEARLINLAKTHDVLTRENWVSANLAEIIADTVNPYSGGESRFGIDGPDVFLVPSAALAIAMALHELATNAMKYGALSGNDGRVGITWRIDDDGDGRRLRLSWTESGGPTVIEPTRKGFGSRLIERALAMELEGTVRVAYESSGVVCMVDAPLLKIQNGQKGFVD